MEDEEVGKALDQMKRNSGVSSKKSLKTSQIEPRPSQFKNKENMTTGKPTIATISKFDELDPVKRLEIWENEPDLIEVVDLN